jgi:hypothetical protein
MDVRVNLSIAVFLNGDLRFTFFVASCLSEIGGYNQNEPMHNRYSNSDRFVMKSIWTRVRDFDNLLVRLWTHILIKYFKILLV